MDIEIGRVIEQIRKSGKLDDTLILFVSDNGASSEQIIRGDLHEPSLPPGSAKTFLGLGPGWASAANTPHRLHKSWTHEGGISTPLIVHWPNGIAAHGELRKNPGHLIDLAPTILELGGGQMPATFDDQPMPPSPGKSLVNAFTHDNSVRHEDFWWFHDNNKAIRQGNWKLVRNHSAPWELYDLTSDRSETRDVAAAHPDKVRELEQLWNQHLEKYRTEATQELTRPKTSH
jgi:arylsulfatase